jgi:hypothetical protein
VTLQPARTLHFIGSDRHCPNSPLAALGVVAAFATTTGKAAFIGPNMNFQSASLDQFGSPARVIVAFPVLLSAGAA